MKIDIDNFNFSRNSIKIKDIENNPSNYLPNSLDVCYKKLGITNKEINNKSIDSILDKLENKKNQKKIINCITNHKKIPKKTIDYFKNLKSMYSKKNISFEVSDDEIKQIIIDYLRIKYNEMSIFDIDIYFIYCSGWKHNDLDKEGPSEYIFERIKELNKKKNKKESYCIIS
jgi:hypothetical protein